MRAGVGGEDGISRAIFCDMPSFPISCIWGGVRGGAVRLSLNKPIQSLAHLIVRLYKAARIKHKLCQDLIFAN